MDGNTDALFDEAAKQYQVVVEQLSKLSKRYPWISGGGPETIQADEGSQEAVN